MSSRKRRTHYKAALPSLAKCPQCFEAKLSHRTFLVQNMTKLPIHLKQAMKNKKPMRYFVELLAAKRSFTNLAVSYYTMLNPAEVRALDVRLQPALG